MAESAVLVRLHRGLGNKLFQFATGYALARRLGVPLHGVAGNHNDVAASLLGDLWQPATRAELWRCGIVRPSPATPVALASLALAAARTRRAASAVAHQVGGRPRRCFAVSPAHVYDPDFESLTAPCYLFGYFQHHAYWQEVVDELATAVGAALGVGPSRPGAAPVIGVHVRRTDFVDTGSALDAGYYRSALARLDDDLDGPVLRLVGDDPSFVHDLGRRLEAEGHRLEVDPDRSGRTGDRDERSGTGSGDTLRHDLARLAGCDHLVLSNSTFAWWGAALGDAAGHAPGRRVIAPDRWTPSCDSTVLLRPGWETAPATMAPADPARASGFDDWWAPAAARDRA